ncbi:MAG: DUF1275 domain-containing protein [Burkholderiales bacterium]|nr:DUF1275 domain-containing protein [Burkholderiales bacterium]
MPDAGSLWPALLLSFVGGYVDTFSFVMLFGLFTAHVTGNFVLIGAALAGHGHAGVLGKLLALPVFVGSVAATRWYQRRRAGGESESARALVLIQLIGLGLFMACGHLVGVARDADSSATILTGLVGVAAMAVQNAAARSVFVRLSPTTVMTGNVTQVTMDLVDLLHGDVPRADAVARMGRLWPPIAAFAIGAVAAGVCCGTLGFDALLLPGLALSMLWCLLRRPTAA